MADQKIIITSTNTNGQTLQKTLTNINPDAGNTELKTFAQMFNGLSQNTYGRTDRVIKYNCDTESGGDNKQTPTLTLEKSTDTKANVFAAVNGNYLQYKVNLTYDGDGELFIHSSNPLLFTTIYFDSSTQQKSLGFATDYTPTTIAGMVTEDATITIRSTETATYKAAEVTFTVTV